MGIFVWLWAFCAFTVVLLPYSYGLDSKIRAAEADKLSDSEIIKSKDVKRDLREEEKRQWTRAKNMISWGKRMSDNSFKSDDDDADIGQDKRAWKNSGAWGKRDAEDAGQGVEKRGWKGSSGRMWGKRSGDGAKRRWQSGAWGKRSEDDDSLDQDEVKRGWKDSSSRLWGKRNVGGEDFWDKVADEDNDDDQDLLDKRGWKSSTSRMWGRRRRDTGAVDAVAAADEASDADKRRWSSSGAWGKRGWKGSAYRAWGKRYSGQPKLNQDIVEELIHTFNKNDDQCLDKAELSDLVSQLAIKLNSDPVDERNAVDRIRQ